MTHFVSAPGYKIRCFLPFCGAVVAVILRVVPDFRSSKLKAKAVVSVERGTDITSSNGAAFPVASLHFSIIISGIEVPQVHAKD